MPKQTGKALLIWGGVSSVDATAIQLAVAAGLTVVSTASSKDFELVKSLGTSVAFDYKSTTVVEGGQSHFRHGSRRVEETT
ncbi:hypothetical protein PISL3812_00780 [Talaromyces islandicus]|uniref:Alcohol dehydrogenase-like C-terminal domain-containing protein n=1 Tax=Talaromyces islandicus TaxID=28573 RepID=A0A0U1LK79_TALIS|nr:hypothetical protein PISL3812_00780 [Talaromyces islandicus]